MLSVMIRDSWYDWKEIRASKTYDYQPKPLIKSDLAVRLNLARMFDRRIGFIKSHQIQDMGVA